MGHNKVFIPIAGKPIVVHSLEIFQRSPLVQRIVVVAAEHEVALYQRHLLPQYRISKAGLVLAGGQRRFDSELRAVRALEPEIRAGEVSVVLVHDAVRPLFPPDRLASLLDAARRTGAAVVAVRAAETVYGAQSSSYVEQVYERDRLWVAQTPQAFHADLLVDAFCRAEEDGFAGTDTASAVLRLGHPVAIVAGNRENIKITTPVDLLLADLLLSGSSFHAEAFSLPAPLRQWLPSGG